MSRPNTMPIARALSFLLAMLVLVGPVCAQSGDIIKLVVPESEFPKHSLSVSKEKISEQQIRLKSEFIERLKRADNRQFDVRVSTLEGTVITGIVTQKYLMMVRESDSVTIHSEEAAGSQSRMKITLVEIAESIGDRWDNVVGLTSIKLAKYQEARVRVVFESREVRDVRVFSSTLRYFNGQLMAVVCLSYCTQRPVDELVDAVMKPPPPPAEPPAPTPNVASTTPPAPAALPPPAPSPPAPPPPPLQAELKPAPDKPAGTMKVMVSDSSGQPAKSVEAYTVTRCTDPKTYQGKPVKLTGETNVTVAPVDAKTGMVCLVLLKTVAAAANQRLPQPACVRVHPKNDFQLPEGTLWGTNSHPCVLPKSKVQIDFKVAGQTTPLKDIEVLVRSVAFGGERVSATGTVEIPTELIEQPAGADLPERLEIKFERELYDVEKVSLVAGKAAMVLDLKLKFVRLGQFKLVARTSLDQIESTCQPVLEIAESAFLDDTKKVLQSYPRHLDQGRIKLYFDGKDGYTVDQALANLPISNQRKEIARISFVPTAAGGDTAAECKLPGEAPRPLRPADFEKPLDLVVRQLRPYALGIFTRNSQFPVGFFGKQDENYFWVGAVSFFSSLKAQPRRYEGAAAAAWQLDEAAGEILTGVEQLTDQQDFTVRVVDAGKKVSATTAKPFDFFQIDKRLYRLIRLDKPRLFGAHIVIMGPRLGEGGRSACDTIRDPPFLKTRFNELKNAGVKFVFLEVFNNLSQNVLDRVTTDKFKPVPNTDDQVHQCIVHDDWKDVALSFVIQRTALLAYDKKYFDTMAAHASAFLER